MKSKKSFSKSSLFNDVLTNASLLSVSDLKISDRLKIDASMLQGEKVLALHKSRMPKIKQGQKCKYWNHMPYKPLPNAALYKIVNSVYDWVPGLFGMAERMYKTDRLILNWRNVQANRFIQYRFNHLGHLRDLEENKEYWTQAIKLLKSPVFQLMALGAIFPSWQRELKLEEVQKIMGEVETLVLYESTDICLRRVYIPKANGKVRPLGVPTKAWRIYLHMWYCLVVWYRMGKDRNNAYIPGRGIHTAWLELLNKLNLKENIYEFDLLSFFPSVNLDAMQDLMINELKMPARVAGYLTALNRSITILRKEDKLNEDIDRKVLLTPSGKINPNLNGEIKQKVESAILANSSEAEIAKLLPNSEWKLYKETGVPQGAGTSCSLSTINLWKLWEQYKENLVMYADDGIAFPNETDEVKYLTDVPRGVYKNEEKSGWIKMQGRLIKKSFKFLGLEITFGSDQQVCSIKSSTRNGANLELTENRSLLIFLQMEWDKLRTAYGITTEGIQNEIGYGGKVKQDVSRSEIRPASAKINEELLQLTVGEWLSIKMDEFNNLSSCNKIRNLFLQRGLGALSEMYNGEWGKLRYEVLNKIVVGSWVYQNGGRYIYEELLGHPKGWLEIIYWHELKALGVIPEIETASLLEVDITKSNIFLDLPDKLQVKVKKLCDEMAHNLAVINKWFHKPEYESTLNSCFLWNIGMDKTAIPELKQVLIYLLKKNPLTMEGMRTLATAEVLNKKLVKEAEIRCLKFRTSDWKIVERLRPNAKVEGKQMNMKKIRKEAGWPSSLKKLV